MRRIAWLAGLVPIGVVWACSSAGSHPNALEGNPGQDSGYIVPIKDTGVPDTYSCVGGGGGCNALQLCGLEVNLVTVTTPAPTPTGGAIVDGTYVLTSATFYKTGVQGVSATLRQVFQISASGVVSDGGAEAGSDGGSMEAGSDDGSAEAGSDDGSAEVGSDGATGGPNVMLTVQDIHQEPPAAPVTATWSVTIEPPSTLAWGSTCGYDSGFVSDGFQYTATPTSLLLFHDVAPGGIGTTVTTFTKQ